MAEGRHLARRHQPDYNTAMEGRLSPPCSIEGPSWGALYVWAGYARCLYDRDRRPANWRSTCGLTTKPNGVRAR